MELLIWRGLIKVLTTSFSSFIFVTNITFDLLKFVDCTIVELVLYFRLLSVVIETHKTHDTYGISKMKKINPASIPATKLIFFNTRVSFINVWVRWNETFFCCCSDIYWSFLCCYKMKMLVAVGLLFTEIQFWGHRETQTIWWFP